MLQSIRSFFAKNVQPVEEPSIEKTGPDRIQVAACALMLELAHADQEFTDEESLITEHYDEGQRMVLAEVLWRLVYSDGRLARHEDYLMRKLANLLELKAGYLAAARKRAAAEYNID
jgi:uncharacterized tellurite resistance protein B-like protein